MTFLSAFVLLRFSVFGFYFATSASSSISHTVVKMSKGDRHPGWVLETLPDIAMSPLSRPSGTPWK